MKGTTLIGNGETVGGYTDSYACNIDILWQ